MSFAIRSKYVVMPEGIREAIVVVETGKIQDILPYHTSVELEVHDLGEGALLPGLIDPHVHINEPGRTDWEGFDTATSSALASGITSLADMPLNSSPVTTTLAALEEKKNATIGKLHTNVGFWGGLVPGNETEIEALIHGGVLGFKGFLTHSGIDEFPNVTEKDLQRCLPIIAKYDLPVLLHCELSESQDDRKQANKRSYGNYLASRPRAWEDKAVSLAISLADQYQCKIHIVHLSSSDSIARIERAKSQGIKITAETAQHYLFFNSENIPEGATQFKCAPPIREKENNEQLWQALKTGTIDFVATDHSPAPSELKQIASGDFNAAWGGIASLQFAFPALWTPAKERGCTLLEMSQWMSMHPSRLIMQPHKGKIVKGCDADLTVIAPNETFQVEEKNILHKHKITPYLGLTLSGKVLETYLGGQKVFAEGKIIQSNQGKILNSIHVSNLEG